MAPPPSEQTILVATAALREDGRRWQDAATELAAARDAASRLLLGRFEFSTPASWTSLVETYQELQQRFTRLQAADMSDARMTDGDSSDWRLRY